MLKLWTIRHIDDFRHFNETGLLRASSQFIDKDMLNAYQWMANQLNEKKTSPKGCDYPLWAWYQYKNATKPKPDLRTAGFLPSGTQGVRIEFEIDVSQVLLSNFDAWHAVLNEHFFAATEEEYEAFEKKEPSLSDSEKQRLIEESWLRIFDMELTKHLGDTQIQAVFWELNKEQVTDVTHFTAR